MSMEDILRKYFNCKSPFKMNETLSLSGERAYAKLIDLLGDIDELLGSNNFSNIIDELDKLAPSDDKNMSKFVD